MTGDQGLASARRGSIALHGAARARAGPAVRDRAGASRGGGSTLGQRAAQLPLPVLAGRRGARRGCWHAHRRGRPHRWRCDVRLSRPSPLAAIAQEFWRGAGARGAMTGRVACRVALVALVRRNRRRYGGYVVHARDRRPVRRRGRVVGLPARARRAARRRGRHARSTATRSPTAPGRRDERRHRREDHARRGARRLARTAITSRRCARARNYYPSAGRRSRSGPSAASSRARRPARWA